MIRRTGNLTPTIVYRKSGVCLVVKLEQWNILSRFAVCMLT